MQGRRNRGGKSDSKEAKSIKAAAVEAAARVIASKLATIKVYKAR